MTDPLSPTPLSEEADAIIGAFFSYARDNGECNLLTMKSTDPQYRCSCGFSEWNRRAEALRVALRQTPQSASWTLDLYVHTLEGIARGESNAAAFAHSALELARSRLSPGVAEPLLNGPTLIDEDGVEHICHALIEVGPWDEIDGDGTEASIIADHIRDLAVYTKGEEG